MKNETVRRLMKRPVNYRWVSAITPRKIRVAGVILAVRETDEVLIQRADGRKNFWTHIDNVKYR